MSAVRYYRRVREDSVWFKRCGYCAVRNNVLRDACVGCGRPLRRRETKRHVLPLEARLAREGELLDQWLAKMQLAATKVGYYRRRVKTLERQRATAASRVPAGARGIRVREP